MVGLKIIPIFISVWALLAQADPVNLTCASEPLTTSVVLFTTADDVTVRILHHNGVSFLPLASQDVTPHDLPMLQERAHALSQLGAQYDLHLKSSSCRVTPEKFIDCYGSIQEWVNGHSLSWLSVNDSKVISQSALNPAPHEQRAMTVAFTMDGKDYSFRMLYEPRSCIETASGTVPSSLSATYPFPTIF